MQIPLWFDEPAPLRNGGHLALGWNFQLPVIGPGIEGQPDWQFCLDSHDACRRADETRP
jgi:hypothetical protein